MRKIFVFLSFIFALSILTGCSESNTPEKTFDKDNLEVCLFSQGWINENVKPKMKNPNSLFMPECSSTDKNELNVTLKSGDITSGGSNEESYFLQSYYMGENSFGGNTKKEYACIVIYGVYPSYRISCSIEE